MIRKPERYEAIVFYIIEPEPPTRKDESILVTQVIGKAEIQPGARLLRSENWSPALRDRRRRFLVKPGVV